MGKTSDDLVLPRQFLRMCRRCLRLAKAADSSGLELSGAEMLTGTLALRRVLRRQVLADDESYVGVLLPPSVGSALANAALALDRRVTVNLNYSLSSDVLNACLAQCGIRHVLTSPRVMERFSLKLRAKLVFIEDLRRQMTWRDKLTAAAQTWLVPPVLLERMLGLTKIRPDNLLTVMFTSGSTGEPKGVMLSHRNVGTNLTAFNAVLRLQRSDVLLGVLPMFHAFGYTTTLWTALALEPKAVYHYTPLEARQIGTLCRRHGCTILIATPTFLRNYLRRCEPKELATLDMVIAGAERLPRELAEEFQRRFGVLPVEGYGTTELSPVVSTNVPPSRQRPGDFSNRPGTIGRPLSGISVKVVDRETGEDMPPGEPGILLVRGPNVMQGYLDRPDLTAEVLRDGWYATGDVATIDADGFIRIIGRVNRFSKLGGEMVPHVAVEDAIKAVLREDIDQIGVVVTAVPDSRRGERLVVLHEGLSMSPEEICRRLVEHGLPLLWIPSPDSFRHVEAIPVLGSGKLDLKRMKERAMEEFCSLA